MFLLRPPSAEVIANFIQLQQTLPFTYAEVGATNEVVPRNYNVDRHRIQLGTGKEVFRRAVAALRAWKEFELGWVKIVPAGTTLKAGATVAIQAKVFGVWSLNACRVVYVIIEEDENGSRFGFAYGTLPEHVESGEERFLIEWNAADDSVWYEILAFSRPQQLLVKIGKPVARVLQRRFARDSLRVLKSEVS